MLDAAMRAAWDRGLVKPGAPAAEAALGLLALILRFSPRDPLLETLRLADIAALFPAIACAPQQTVKPTVQAVSRSRCMRNSQARV